MPRDYKPRPQAGRKEQKTPRQLPAWKSALGGFVVGLFVAVGAFVEGRYPGTIITGNDTLVPVPDGTAIVQADADETRVRKPTFEFYTLLPEVEVEVTGEPAPLRKTREEKAQAAQDAKTLASQNSAKSAPKRSSGTHVAAAKQPSAAEPGVAGYMLQVGSFKELNDADRLRARLTLGGHDALIQSVSVNADTWHRVRLGPFGDRQSANRVRAALQQNQVPSMVLPIRG